MNKRINTKLNREILTPELISELKAHFLATKPKERELQHDPCFHGRFLAFLEEQITNELAHLRIEELKSQADADVRVSAVVLADIATASTWANRACWAACCPGKRQEWARVESRLDALHDAAESSHGQPLSRFKALQKKETA